MLYKTVIVDDEQPICDEIEYLLKDYRDIKVLAKLNSGLDLLLFLGDNDVDLIFLDVKMPGLSGIELARKLSSAKQPPLVVFVTAFQEFALDAFDTPAVGYVTKPITEEKLARVLSKVRTILCKRDNPAKGSVPNKLCVHVHEKIIPIGKQEVVFAYVREKDVFIRTNTNEYATTLSLQEIENILTDANFLRVHRQYLVNLDKIREIIPWFHGTYLLKMDDHSHEEVPVSRGRMKILKNAMGLK